MKISREFLPRMESRTRGLRPIVPLSYRRFAGAIADVWRVHGGRGGGGFYIAPDPRVVIFLDESPPPMALRTSETATEHRGVQGLYIPAGVPLWSRMETAREMMHLDFHLEAGALQQRLAHSGVHADLTRPRMIGPGADLVALGRIAAAEVCTPRRGEMMLDGLLRAALAEFFDTVPQREPMAQGGLSPYQFGQIERHLRANLHRRVGVAELAEVAGLSGSWFAHCFRRDRNETPQRWQARIRLEAAREMIETSTLPMAEIAHATGFADQAHLSRQFRAMYGIPPSVWRRRGIQPV
ncbi:helix-turn-helix domain-containing protein [Paenirhodobacter populi]|nr:AraC family transcriptional regulator [Sinirhodobacter populi]